MKKILILSIGLLSIILLSSSKVSAQVYRSKCGKEVVKYSEIKIGYEGSTVYFKREFISEDREIPQQVFNLSGLSFEDHIINIPEGGRYWFIPFDDAPPFMMNGGQCLAECKTTYECSRGNCDWHNNVCDCGSSRSNPCHVIICGHEGGGAYIGPGIFVHADKVVQGN